MFAEECRTFGFKLYSEARTRGRGAAVLVKDLLPVLI